jgi:hypothetical protein
MLSLHMGQPDLLVLMAKCLSREFADPRGVAGLRPLGVYVKARQVYNEGYIGTSEFNIYSPAWGEKRR